MSFRTSRHIEKKRQNTTPHVVPALFCLFPLDVTQLPVWSRGRLPSPSLRVDKKLDSGDLVKADLVVAIEINPGVGIQSTCVP